jgi:restriction system protein
MNKSFIWFLGAAIAIIIADKSPKVFWLFLLVGCTGVIVYLYFVQYNQKIAISEAESIINEHSKTLFIKYKTLVYQDDYGNVFHDAWKRESEYFINNVIIKKPSLYNYLVDNNGYFKTNNLKKIFSLIDKAIAVADHKHVSPNDNFVSVDEMDAIDFEKYCAALLSRDGWTAQTTNATGDQGVDIFATKEGITAVFQCKRYSQSVGNFAVQEIYAGKNFLNANVAAVVSNSGYTKSAKQLAKSTGVFLLHYSDLENFHQKLEALSYVGNTA